MGQHTFFYKDREKCKEMLHLHRTIEQAEKNLITLTEDDICKIENRLSELEDNESEFCDAFRTNKRNADGTYFEHYIFSKEECIKWIEENKDSIWYFDKEYFNQFWEKYPYGAVGIL
jgi:hypothetical protein